MRKFFAILLCLFAFGCTFLAIGCTQEKETPGIDSDGWLDKNY